MKRALLSAFTVKPNEMDSEFDQMQCTDVDALIDELEARGHELDVDGLNDSQILGTDLTVFLSSPQGREFGDHLRHEAYGRLDAVQERSRALRQEIKAVEEDLRVAITVFAFVDSVTYRVRDERRGPMGREPEHTAV